MRGRSVRLLLTMGDPAGVGPELLLKVIGRRDLAASTSLSVIVDLRWIKRLARRFRLSVPWSRFQWVDVGDLCSGIRWGRVQAQAGRAAVACLQEAVRRLKAKEADALVTAPVSKEAIVRAGISWRGHTEYLADRFHVHPTMMFVTGKFRASLVTTHWPLREVPARLTRTRVLRAVQATDRCLQQDFGILRPRIGLAALNPHAGEGGLLGSEEKKILLPAVRSLDLSVQGPIPSDALMERAARGEFDAVVALYHDQALIPVKLLGWDQAVNVTLGLPFVRTSPVHGTAWDLAGTGRADPASMQSAVRLAVELARRRLRDAQRPHH